MTFIEELPEPAEYLEASLRFKMIWDEYLDKEEEVKSEIVFMVKILEDEGYSRTKAIQKIIEDHKELKGFSRATIYRELPNDMKNNYISGAKQLSNTGNVSFETSEKLQEKGENFVNIITSKYNTQDAQETEEKLSSLVVDLPEPEPELQDPKITMFVGKIPKSVLRLAEKIELSPTKLELIVEYSKKSILKDHRPIQETLVKSIASLTIDQAKIEISQAVRDLETGAIEKIEGQNSYVMNYDQREKIPMKVDRVKHPIENYSDLLTKFRELMHLGTGHKLTEDESCYEPNHIHATQKHRFALLNEIDKRQLVRLVGEIEIVRDLLDSFLHEIDETFNNPKK